MVVINMPLECKPNKSSKQVIKQLFSVTFLGRCIPHYLDDELDLMCSFFPLASGSRSPSNQHGNRFEFGHLTLEDCTVLHAWL